MKDTSIYILYSMRTFPGSRRFMSVFALKLLHDLWKYEMCLQSSKKNHKRCRVLRQTLCEGDTDKKIVTAVIEDWRARINLNSGGPVGCSLQGGFLPYISLYGKRAIREGKMAETMSVVGHWSNFGPGFGPVQIAARWTKRKTCHPAK